QLGNLGEVERSLGNYTAAMDRLQTGLQLSRDVCASLISAHLLVELAEVANARGDSVAALALVSECLAIARGLSHLELEAWLIVIRGDAELAPGRLTDAARSHQLSLGVDHQLGCRGAGSWGLDRGGGLLPALPRDVSQAGSREDTARAVRWARPSGR